MFDNSDFPKDSPYHDAKNKKVIGKFKDEAAGVPIVEFEGLRSKMYLPVKDNGKNVKTAKGVKKYVITKNIKHENYKDTTGADYLESTLSDEKLFLEIAFAEYFSLLLSNIQLEQSYDHASHADSQKRGLNCCQRWR